jgi:NCS1 family nucleobase:cation symporter-1
MGLALLIWAYMDAGGFGAMLSAPSQFVEGGAKEGQFWPTFLISVTAMVGFWATVALNIPDFTRFAKSQRDQALGQLIGLPLSMAFLAFVSVCVTSATVVIYGEAIWDPVQVASRMGGVGVIVALGALIIATLTTNLAANVVAPANGLSNLSPKKISFMHGGSITALIGILIFPWKLVENASAYIFTWLVGYSALLGPIAGLLIADYYIVRKRRLDTQQLFQEDGMYGANNGYNWNGVIAFVLGILPNLPGFLFVAGGIDSVAPIFQQIYTFAWFVGFIVSAVVYIILCRLRPLPMK